jgi:hypothetical protein
MFNKLLNSVIIQGVEPYAIKTRLLFRLLSVTSFFLLIISFKELLFFKSGCKGKQVFLINKFFCNFFYKTLYIKVSFF